MRLKEMRIAARLSQKEAAQRIGVVQSAVAHWENQGNHPRLSKLPKIAEAYGCTVADLLGDADNENPPTAAET